MRILTVDIGTGTQDIFLYDSRFNIENGYKMIMPAPTLIIAQKIAQATRQQQSIAISGFIMGGGPCAWVMEKHLRSGNIIYASSEAAKTINDDLDLVREMGLRIISEGEIKKLPESIIQIELRDFDLQAIENAFKSFGIHDLNLDVVAVAVFDHGAAPADVSDRKFRFDYLHQRIQETNRLSGFAYRSENIPDYLTRLKAVDLSSPHLSCPLVVMDTAPAAILGACLDPSFRAHTRMMVINIGNFHTIAFRLGPNGIEGIFEHHTGLLNPQKLDRFLYQMADCTLDNLDVFQDHGHGALNYTQNKLHLEDNVLVTGPRRGMMKDSQIKPRFAAPFGDMMISGCFGLLAATADLLPDFAAIIHNSFSNPDQCSNPPWDSLI